MSTAHAFVDAHHHFQDLDTHYYPWLCDRDAPPKLEGDLGPIRRNYRVDDYCANLKSAGLVKSVHVQNGWDPSDPVGETRWLQGEAEVHGFPHAIVAYADLSSPDVESVLADHCRFANVRGVRQILNWHEDPRLRVAASPDLMRQPAWRRGFGLLSRYGLSFDLQIYWPQMDDALDLARAYPDTSIILNHFGMPVDRSPEAIDSWRAAMHRLSRAENVCTKLSGLGLGHPHWTVEDTIPLLSYFTREIIAGGRQFRSITCSDGKAAQTLVSADPPSDR